VENSLKQRIIGAVVLAALAAIFLPAILKEKTSSGTFVSKIPQKPEALEEYRVDTKKIDQLTQEKDNLIISDNEAAKNNNDLDKAEPANDNLESQKSNGIKEQNSQRKSKVATPTSNSSEKSIIAVSKANPDKSQATKKLKSPQENNSQTINDKFKSAAWVVQVASFSNESNAINLVTKLKKSNFKAYRRKVVAEGKTVFRVYVGPYIDKPKAQKATSSISKVSETTVALRPFDPVKH